MWFNPYTLCSKKSDAKIQITITTAYLIRLKYLLNGLDYHLSDVNVANFNKIYRKVSEQQLFWKWNSKTEVSNMENTDWVDFFTFQQNNAPAHRAGDTVEFLSRNTPDFSSPLLWPPNSPDLNPVDYEVWGVVQQRVYRSRIRDVDHLKQSLVEKWRCFDQNIIDWAVRQWRVRLRACVRANGGHFEHKL